MLFLNSNRTKTLCKKNATFFQSIYPKKTAILVRKWDVFCHHICHSTQNEQTPTTRPRLLKTIPAWATEMKNETTIATDCSMEIVRFFPHGSNDVLKTRLKNVSIPTGRLPINWSTTAVLWWWWRRRTTWTWRKWVSLLHSLSSSLPEWVDGWNPQWIAMYLTFEWRHASQIVSRHSVYSFYQPFGSSN